MNWLKCCLLILLFCSISCTSFTQEVLPAYNNSSAQTIHLYNRLFKVREKGFFFGHQDDLAYGVNWKYKPGASDVKEAAGDYPAVYGWELGGLEHDVPKILMLFRLKQ